MARRNSEFKSANIRALAAALQESSEQLVALADAMDKAGGGGLCLADS